MNDNMPNTNNPYILDSVSGEWLDREFITRRNLTLDALSKTRKRVKCATGERFRGNYIREFEYDFDISMPLTTRTGSTRKNGGILVSRLTDIDGYAITAILYGSPVAEVHIRSNSENATVYMVWIPSRTTITVLSEFSKYLRRIGIKCMVRDEWHTYRRKFAEYEDFKREAIFSGNYEPSSGVGRY